MTQPTGGRLFVVATPIGNLGDVTLRALETLRAVPLIAAEDTRISRRLLARYEIDTRLVSFHARNAKRRLPELLDHLRGGLDLAVVTDAGTPGVSDPGEELVRAWAGESGLVAPIPGPSAVLAAVVASGLAGPRWTFEGFLPRSGRDRRERLARIAADERGCVVYEAPGRVTATLADLAAACGSERPAAVCRELTKLHEEVVRGRLGELATAARDGGLTLRGEFVLVIGEWRGVAVAGGPAVRGRRGPQPLEGTDDDPEVLARAAVERLVGEGVARGDAARRIAAETGIPRRRLYGAPTTSD
ncbi:MAG: 16S rRNA (cytidine(1402)-2'-O)-methyltransferase [Candidatus Limnocylindrales bacterium]